MLRWFEHRQIYFPQLALDSSAAELGRPFEDIEFLAADGTRLNAWFFPADPDSSRKRLTLLLCHGNAGNISHRLDLYQLWLEQGLNVFAFDYRGYGRSQGRPSESGTYLDAQAAYQWLRQKGFNPQEIIVLGESLGGGVAAELAQRETPGALILQSAFTSIVDVGCELFPWLPVRRLCTIHYDTQSKLPQIKCPLLILHSRGDTMIGFHHAEKNFVAANEPKMLWELAGDHNDRLLAAPQRYQEGLRNFFKMLESLPSAPVVRP